MKFLVVFAGIAISGLTKDSVTAQDRSTIDSIKQKAKDLYRKVDNNKDGKVSIDELTEGLKKGLGFGESQEQRQNPSYTRQLYQKFVGGDKNRHNWFTQQDFEEIFTSKSKSSSKKEKKHSDQEDESTLEYLRKKAGGVYKSFDKNNDGHVTLEQVTQGLKRGLGFSSDDEQDDDDKQNKKDQKSLISQAQRLYQKYVKSDKKDKKWFTQQDFQDIIKNKKSQKCSKKKKCKDQQSTFQLLKNKAGDVYDKFDSNHDGHVSFQELTQGLKSGLGFSLDDQDGKKDKDQSSLKKYADQLYEKYVKSDKKDNKSFSRQDFIDIFQQKNKQSYLQKAKNKANEIHKSFDSNKDGHISLQQVTSGIKSGLGFVSDDQSDDQDQNTISQKVNQLYEKYVKSDKKDNKGFTMEDITDIVQTNMKKAKKKISQKASDVKQGIEQLADSVKGVGSQAKQKVQKTASSTKKKVEKKASKVKDQVSQSAENVKDKISQKVSQTVETISDKASDIKESVKDSLQDAWQSGQQKMQSLKKKASQIYKSFDKDGDDNISLEELKNALKTSLGFDSDTEDKQDEKGLIQRATQMYNKYVKSDKKDSKFSQKDFFQTYLSEKKKKDKSFVEKLKAKANKIYQSFDKNNNGHITLQQLTAGIKSGLWFDEDKDESNDENTLKSYLSNLYQKYVKSDSKNKQGFTKQDFYDIIKRRQKKMNYKKSGYNLQQLKNKAFGIYQKFDKNKDGHVQIQQITQGIKNKLGFEDENQKDQNSLFSYAKSLYEKYIKSGKKEVKLTKDDFADIIYQWKDQCSARSHQKQRPEQL